MMKKDAKISKHLLSLGYGKKAESKGGNRMTEEELIQDYPSRNIVVGSLTFLETENKQQVSIVCATEGCDHTRKVRTSDLWQVENCTACTRKAKRERAREKRKAKKAEKEG